MKLHVSAVVAISTISLFISACSTMNSEFSCNATAGDSCMTIEQVDAMTRYADGNGRVSHLRKYQRQGAGVRRYKSAHHRASEVWIAPAPMK